MDNAFKDGTRKNRTVSSFVEIKETSERFLISYKLEQRKKDEEYAFVTYCYIYKYSPNQHKFLLFHSFLADINTKGT